jgi:hypothetical protein
MAAASVADTLKQLNATTFTAKYPDFGATAPGAVATAPLPHGEACSSSFPWMLIIGLAIGAALTFLAVKMWAYWRNTSTAAQAPALPPSLATPPAETLIQELARQMVHSARPANNTPFVQQTVPVPSVVDVPPSMPGVVPLPNLPPMAAPVAAPAPPPPSDPNFEPLFP